MKQTKRRKLTSASLKGWKLIDTSKKCFKLQELVSDDAFIVFNFHGPTSLLKIFKSFVSDGLLHNVLVGICGRNGGIQDGSKKPKGDPTCTGRYPKFMYPDIKKLKQKLAYEIRIIGLQKSPQENEK